MTTSTPWPDAAHPPSKLDDRSDSSPAVPGSHASDHTAERQRINALLDKVNGVLDGSVPIPGAAGGVTVEDAGVAVATRDTINLIEGANVTLTIADNPGSDRVDVTIDAAGGGGSTVEVAKGGTLVGTRGRINLIEGANVTLTVSDNAGAGRVDVTVAASGGGGGGTKPFLVAASDSPASWKSAAAYQCDSTDDQVEINAALLAAVNSGKGGKVELAPGTFNISTCILMQGRVRLEGSGWGTNLNCVSGTWGTVNGYDAGVVRLLWDGSASAGHATYGEGWEIRGFRITANSVSAHGIYINIANNGTFLYHGNDNKGRVHDIWMNQTGKSGLCLEGHAASAGLRSIMCSHIQIYNASQYGVEARWSCTDSWLDHIDVGNATLDGFAFLHSGGNGASPFKLTACKAWYCNQNGFLVQSSRVQLTNCEAQNNNKSGFRIEWASGTLTGCLADCNGTTGTGTEKSGFYIATSVAMAGCVSVNDTAISGSRPQTYGYAFVGSPVVSIGGCMARTANSQTPSTGSLGAGSSGSIVAYAA